MRNDERRVGTNGAGTSSDNGYQGIDAHNDLEGSGWRENLSVDEEAVRRSKELLKKNEGNFERRKDREASQSVK